MSHVSSMQKRNKNMLLPNDVRGMYLNFKQAICHWLLGRAIMDIYLNACACIHTNTQIYNVSVSIPIYDYIFIYVLYIYMYDIIYHLLYIPTYPSSYPITFIRPYSLRQKVMHKGGIKFQNDLVKNNLFLMGLEK